LRFLLIPMIDLMYLVIAIPMVRNHSFFTSYSFLFDHQGDIPSVFVNLRLDAAHPPLWSIRARGSAVQVCILVGDVSVSMDLYKSELTLCISTLSACLRRCKRYQSPPQETDCRIRHLTSCIHASVRQCPCGAPLTWSTQPPPRL